MTLSDSVLAPGALAPVDLPAEPISKRVRRFRRVPVQTAAVVAVATAATVLLWEYGTLALVPALSGTLFLTEVMALPAYERDSSLRPVARTLALAGGLLLTLVALGWLTVPEVRLGLWSVAAVLVLPVVVRGVRQLIPPARTTLLVGDRVAVSHLVTQWATRPQIQLAGICLAEPDDDADDQPTQIGGVPVVGGLEDVALLARAQEIPQVVVAPGPVLTAYDVRRLSWALEDSDVELAVAAEVHGAVPRRIEPRLLGRRLLLSVRPTRRPVLAVLIKSAFDRTVAAIMLVLLAPLLTTLMVLVRNDSPGPAIFRQVRAGRVGRPFIMYKFRTMCTDAEERRAELEKHNEGAGPLFKLMHDPRVTRMGRWLRRSSLDELPQLVNVLKGDMSLVGPRPALPRETDQYDAWIRRRLSLRPGMTGLWQVSGRSRLSWNETVRLDLDYVDNWTLAGDLSIVARTVNAVLRRDGAA
ncbi:MAG: sugar transferase [Nocardioidaceae bacterium]|nr:sugar transferase [Nocardioidaceae bacterium]